MSWWWLLVAVPVGVGTLVFVKRKHHRRVFRWLRKSHALVNGRVEARRRPHWTASVGRRRSRVRVVQPTAVGASSVGFHGRRRQMRVRRKCSAKCQVSTKPRQACTCPCGGDGHGTQVEGSRQNILHTRYTPEQRAAQRRHAEAERSRRAKQRLAKRMAKAKAPARGGRRSA